MVRTACPSLHYGRSPRSNQRAGTSMSCTLATSCLQTTQPYCTRKQAGAECTYANRRVRNYTSPVVGAEQLDQRLLLRKASPWKRSSTRRTRLASSGTSSSSPVMVTGTLRVRCEASDSTDCCFDVFDECTIIPGMLALFFSSWVSVRMIGNLFEWHSVAIVVTP